MSRRPLRELDPNVPQGRPQRKRRRVDAAGSVRAEPPAIPGLYPPADYALL